MMNFSEQDQLEDIEKKMMSDAEIMLKVVVFSILLLSYLWWRGL